MNIGKPLRVVTEDPVKFLPETIELTPVKPIRVPIPEKVRVLVPVRR